MKYFTQTEVDAILAENVRLRHACRQARRALAGLFDGPPAAVVQGESPLHLPTPVNIFKKGKPRT